MGSGYFGGIYFAEYANAGTVPPSVLTILTDFFIVPAVRRFYTVRAVARMFTVPKVGRVVQL